MANPNFDRSGLRQQVPYKDPIVDMLENREGCGKRAFKGAVGAIAGLILGGLIVTILPDNSGLELMVPTITTAVGAGVGLK